MKKITVTSALIVVLFLGFVLLQNSWVGATEGMSVHSLEESNSNISNPTISAAIERAKEDKNYWYSDITDNIESDTFLALPDGGFLHGEMEDSETGEVWNSETDPKSATLGEIRAAIQEIQKN